MTEFQQSVPTKGGLAIREPNGTDLNTHPEPALNHGEILREEFFKPFRLSAGKDCKAADSREAWPLFQYQRGILDAGTL